MGMWTGGLPVDVERGSVLITCCLQYQGDQFCPAALHWPPGQLLASSVGPDEPQPTSSCTSNSGVGACGRYTLQLEDVRMKLGISIRGKMVLVSNAQPCAPKHTMRIAQPMEAWHPFPPFPPFWTLPPGCSMYALCIRGGSAMMTLSSPQGWLIDSYTIPSSGVLAYPTDLHSAMIWTRQARFQLLGRERL